MKTKYHIHCFVLALTILAAPFIWASAASAYYPVLDAVNNASSFFSKWKVKKWVGKVDVGFKVEDKRDCVVLKSNKSSWAFIRDVKPNLKSTPYLTWYWKVDEYPDKADGKRKKTDDQAAQLYVVFPAKTSLLTLGLWGQWKYRVLGYTWETDTKKGLSYVSKKNSLTRIFVLRDRKDGEGKWFFEKRNVAEDFKKAFGTSAPDPTAVIFQIDSDDTASKAGSAFSEIGFSGS